jgi:hypothetical protein
MFQSKLGHSAGEICAETSPVPKVFAHAWGMSCNDASVSQGQNPPASILQQDFPQLRLSLALARSPKQEP